MESRIVFIIQCLVKCSFILVILDDWVAWTANNYFSVWKQGSSRSRAGQVQFLVSALFLVCWRLLSHCPHLVERTRTDPIMRAPPLQPHLNLITFKHHHLGFRASVSGRHQHSDGRSFPCSDVARFAAVCTFRLTLWLLTPHHSSSMALWDDPSSHFVFLFPGPEISHFPRISGSL